MALLNHDQSKTRKPRVPAARLGVAIDARRNEVIVAREHPEMDFQVTRCPFGDDFDRLTVGEIAVTALHAAAFTNPVSAEVVSSDLGDDAVTEKLAEIIQRDPAWILSRPPEEVTCNWARNDTEQIVLTEAQSQTVQEALNDVDHLITAAEIVKAPSFRVRFETPMHALVRFCAAKHAALAQMSDAATVAFLFITQAGYGVGLWSRRTGLLHETEQILAPDLTAQEIGEQVGDLLRSLLSPSSLKDFGLGPATLLAIALTPDLPGSLIAEINDCLSGLEVELLRSASNGCDDLMEMLAIGAICSIEKLPELDLGDDLRPRAERINARRQAETAARLSQRKQKAALALMIPFLVLCGALLGSHLYISQQVARIAEMQAKEEREKARLQSAESLRRSAEENFKWYVSTINQIIELKQKQPSTMSLLLDLDRRWPASDPTWRLAALRTSPQGAIEIRGTTGSQEAITQFVSALEFGGNFSGIQPEVKDRLLSANDSAANQSSKPVLEFSVKATYAPLAGLLVPARTPTSPNNIMPSRSMMPMPGTAPPAPALTPLPKSDAPVGLAPGQTTSPASPSPTSGENSVKAQNQGGLR